MRKFQKVQIDPDPTTVATVFIAGAALVLQLVQTAKQLSKKPIPVVVDIEARYALSRLSHALDNISAQLERLNDALGRQRDTDAWNAVNNAPFRVARENLYLTDSAHYKFQERLNSSYRTLGILSRWINHVIREEPELAARLGGRMAVGLGETAEALNQAMELGGPIHEVTAAGNRALRELAAAIQAELGPR